MSFYSILTGREPEPLRSRTACREDARDEFTPTD